MSKSLASRAAARIASKFSPVTIVMVVAGLVLGGSVAARLLTRESIDPRVKYETYQGEGEPRASSARPAPAESFGDDDPAVRYADRLRDASALSLAFSLYCVKEGLVKNRVLPNVGAVLGALGNEGLMPPGMRMVHAGGVVQSPAGLYYVRYRPRPFGVEVLAVGARGLDDGEVFIIRVPEAASARAQEAMTEGRAAGAYATIFVAPRSDAPVPSPFVPAESFARAGWKQEPLRRAPYSRQQVEELRTWLAQYQGQEAR